MTLCVANSIVHVNSSRTMFVSLEATLAVINSAYLCDGHSFREHPLFREDSHSLQVQLYYNDVELCNPLGSITMTHKIG